MFEPITQNLSLRDRIVQEILAKVKSGELKPGDRLPPERDLALELNVSRTTIRDALRTLVGFGVVSILHGKGIFVQGNEGVALGSALWAPFVVKPDTVSALFEVRKTLETRAAGLAAVRAPQSQKQQLVKIVRDSMADAGQGEDIDPEAAALADQTDDRDLGCRGPRHHAEQHALADPGPAEQAETLATAAG